MLSGWCGQRGKPACKSCRSELCACRCHGSERAQNKAFPTGSDEQIGENRDEAQAVRKHRRSRASDRSSHLEEVIG